MKVIFVRRRFYRTKLYNIGDILDLNPKDANAYIGNGSAKIYIEPQAIPQIEEQKTPEVSGHDTKTLMELREIAKENGLPIRGTKQEVLNRITKNIG